MAANATKPLRAVLIYSIEQNIRVDRTQMMAKKVLLVSSDSAASNPALVCFALAFKI